MFVIAKIIFFWTTIIVGCVCDLEVLHFGDFMEFHTAFAGCKNSNSVTGKQQQMYTDCITKNLPVPPGDEYDATSIYSRACANENAYRKCWEPIIRKSKECNSANGKEYYPTSFSMVIKAICKKDQGRSFIDGYVKAMKASEHIGDNKDEICKSATGEHWMIACKDLEIVASEKCKKHAALSKCTNRIFCKEIPMAQYLMDVYHEAGKIEGCALQNETSKPTTARYKRPNKRSFYFANN